MRDIKEKDHSTKGNTSERGQEPGGRRSSPCELEADHKGRGQNETEQRQGAGVGKISRDVKETKNGITELKYAFEAIRGRVGSLQFCSETLYVFYILCNIRILQNIKMLSIFYTPFPQHFYFSEYILRE